MCSAALAVPASAFAPVAAGHAWPRARPAPPLSPRRSAEGGRQSQRRAALGLRDSRVSSAPPPQDMAATVAAASSFGLAAYLRRIGLELAAHAQAPSLATLTAVMAAQSRAIPFENLDVVLHKKIAISPSAVEEKLVGSGRGGYCFEQNQLLASALQCLGFNVSPMLCRVRWNKAPDEQTTFTHVALAVKVGGNGSADGGMPRTYLADVGFAGTNSIAPVLLGTSEPQQMPEGLFRTMKDDGGYTTLQWQIKDSWRDLYMFKEEACLAIDLELANWWSCTYPKARFTSQFFVARVIGEERHHILNDTHTIRQPDGTTQSTQIKTKGELEKVLTEVFGIALPTETEGLDRYLS
eukprot:Tamp_15526.p1 GENE.Tamp_15526~~Tamp_15526.p1  ORF type:complete len:352 (+),score=75.89 Tamp_15526:313-1368(+)